MINNDNYLNTTHERTAATIDLKAIRQNVIDLKKCHERSRCGSKKKEYLILASIKANAYGHGAEAISEAISDLVDYYAVAGTQEGLELRNCGRTNHILVLGPAFPEDYPAAIQNELTLTVFRYEEACALNECAASLGSKAHIHAAVDTGMSRIGVFPDETGLETLKKIAALPNLVLDGIFTHFATADEKDKTGADAALGKFLAFRRMCGASGLSVPIWHCANTAAVIDGIGAADDMDMVRFGIGIYGLYPSEEVRKENVTLTPALRWYSFLTFVKEIPAGTSVSYGYHFTADRNMRIGTVCCGYADGYPRILSSKGGEVLIHGKRCRILGSICMDQFMVDLSGAPDAEAGDEVTLLGSQTFGGASDCITAEEIAEKCGTISYEIICGISPRTKRNWV